MVDNSLDCLAAGLRPVTMAANPQTPATPVGPAAAPDPWTMPSRGIEWCDCGEHHDLNRNTVLSFAEDVIEDPQWMTHDEVVDTAMDLWNYISVCEFFLMAIHASAVSVNGETAQRYPFERGLEIVAYFSKTWQGCPEEICRTVRDREG